MYVRILVPLDGSITSLHGLDEAIRLCALTQSTLRLLHVVNELKYAHGICGPNAQGSDLVTEMEEAGAQILRQGRDRANAAAVRAETMLFSMMAARVADIVTEQARAWPAELIVLGTHGRGGEQRTLLGGDAEQVLRRAPVPVLLVRKSRTNASLVAADAVA
ncbi:Nucleotide-binding universal stress protein, UspA family [Variovorax sp. OK605]|jgi:nucleotide-binding universal stress UspA family protein|uniref:universal stress protein n=1 Tax=Variovorax sp. OK605 TaxID=1855317 RepID=UPI0008E4E1EC|nr:universal stress protein [Variovorax sp. OK605]SFQ60220.1 Nucleotide-binding universal stress protein, UspA family [Variovorax sp. OK605]